MGNAENEFFALDMKNNKLFFVAAPDPDATFWVWFFPDQGVSYQYNVNLNLCTQNNFTGSIMNFCVGGENQTFFENITLGSNLAWVWNELDHMGGLSSFAVEDMDNCFPVLIQNKPAAHVGQDKFNSLAIFVDSMPNVDNFQALPAACDEDHVKIGKRNDMISTVPSFLLKH